MRGGHQLNTNPCPVGITSIIFLTPSVLFQFVFLCAAIIRKMLEDHEMGPMLAGHVSGIRWQRFCGTRDRRKRFVFLHNLFTSSFSIFIFILNVKCLKKRFSK